MQITPAKKWKVHEDNEPIITQRSAYRFKERKLVRLYCDQSCDVIMSRFERSPFIKAVDSAIQSPTQWNKFFIQWFSQISVDLYRIINPH